jgi:hypothetical protein
MIGLRLKVLLKVPLTLIEQLSCRRNNHGRQQATVLQSFAEIHFKDRFWVKGCLKLRPEATQEEHDRALSQFNQLFRRKTKQSGIQVKYRGRYHITGLYDKHLDYIAWAKADNVKQVQAIWHECARRAGFVTYSCIQLTHMNQLRIWSNYMFKRFVDPKNTTEYVYLPAKDGTAIIRGSEGFFEGTSYEQLWGEVKARAASNLGTYNNIVNQTTTKMNAYEIVESDLPLAEKIVLLLPQTKDEAILPGLLEWLTGVNEVYILEKLRDNPLVKWEGKCVWYAAPCPSPDTWEKRLWGNCGIPYHDKWFPYPTTYEEEVGKIVKEVDFDRIPMTKEKFDQEIQRTFYGK